MLVNIEHDTPAEHRRLLVAGIAYMTAVVVLIGLSIAIYQKVFTPVTTVTVKADRAGLQLSKFGDVRLHGVLIGQVRSIKQDGKEAVIKIGLKPSQAKKIPSNVSVEIRPTTLFGQKYVALIDPKEPSGSTLHNGSVIPASRVTTNVELQQILATLFPLLRSIRPADLNTTLYALSTALEGRGEKLGQTISDLNTYLAAVNVHLPTVRKDLELLASVSKTYSLAAPDIVRLLTNATTTARTLVDTKDDLKGFITATTQLAITGTNILDTNGDAIVTESHLARPLVTLLDTYSPEYTCLFQGIDRYTGRLAQIFRGNRVRQKMSFDAIQRPAYTAADAPQYAGTGHGPWCLGLPNPPVPAGNVKLPDGSNSEDLR
ncbi:MCE family protein [Nocardioides marmorisolisilvae]|uniref:MCE family protein n=1 Tax=Nocardioides marmorisolisilvae TaxID=1542737 RepID=A0A3N0DVA7_9ACTN|nr:MCE family protein [Nocardioides marmorisolisilvae]RNL79554.1 MCE family protein [Nocardioides marmorisolisilvae]